MLGFTPGVMSYDKLTVEQIRTNLDRRAREAKALVTLDILDNIFQDELNSNKKKSNDKARMQDLLAGYRTMLRHNGATWIFNYNQKLDSTMFSWP